MTSIDFKAANGRQRKALRVTITSVFNKKDLTRFLDEEMDLSLENLVEADDFTNMVWELIGHFGKRGMLKLFMDKWIANEEFGRAPELSDLLNNWAVFGTPTAGAIAPPIEVVVTLSPVAPPAGTTPPTVADPKEESIRPDTLEAILDHGVGRIQAAVWLKDMATLSRQVCLVRDNGGATGTGFLIGPRIVLTAAHVVHASQGEARQLSVVFDYNGDDRVPPHIARVEKILLTNPEFGARDDRPDWFQTLDFAVLQLESEPPPAEGMARGWIELASYRSRLHPGEPIMTLAHLEGRGLSVQTGSIANPPSLNGRFGHDAMTLAGASGAPIFDARLRLIGMHEAGLQPTDETPNMNYAIRADAIARELQAKGLKLHE